MTLFYYRLKLLKTEAERRQVRKGIRRVRERERRGNVFKRQGERMLPDFSSLS
jgi:hypothetical protein